MVTFTLPVLVCPVTWHLDCPKTGEMNALRSSILKCVASKVRVYDFPAKCFPNVLSARS